MRSGRSVVYVNHGGIGFLSDAASTLPIDSNGRHQPLRLVAIVDKRILREIAPPICGWDEQRLVAALESERAVVLSFAPVDAFLGNEWIGSTEV